MRIRLMIATITLLLASASLALAQPARPADATIGSIDVGGRFGSVTGDEARFERYRDLRNGAFSRIVFGRITDTLLLDAKAENIGYRDQRYSLDWDNRGRIQLGAYWDSIPLNYSYMSATPWEEESKGVWRLNPAARQAVQNGTPGVVGIPTTSAQLLRTSIWEGLAQPFDLRSQRDKAEVRTRLSAAGSVSLDFLFRTTKRDGYQPFAAAFAFNDANEIPLPNDDRTNDASVGVEWVKPEGMLRVGWESSWYTNNITEFVFDNPMRATDTNPYDPSGYSNGNGAAVGRMSAAPSNSMNALSVTGLYKMPSRTRLSGTASFATYNQNDALIPWTSNQVINSPAVLNAFPGLSALPRPTAEAKVDTLNAMINLTSRPTRILGLDMRYRYNNHDNQTPRFPAEEYVRFDAVPEETGGETQQFDIKRNTLDINGTLNLFSRTALRLSYGYDDFKRTGRAFSDMTDYTGRVSLDVLGAQRVTVRATLEHTKRIGTGFSEDAIEEGGAQPGLRFYDEADRDRNRGTLLLLADPFDPVTVSLSMSAGKDRYHGEGHEFGLLNNSNRSYNAGISYNPSTRVGFGANYGRDTFHSLQESRNANPPQDLTAVPPVLASDYGSWFDPNRSWTLDTDEKVNSANVYLDLYRILPRTDLRFDYDFNDSDNALVHGGPRIQELSTNKALGTAANIVYPLNPATGAPFTIPAPCSAGLTSCFLPLPNVTNRWQRFTVDLKHFFTSKVGVGLGYWYEKLDVVDFGTIDIQGQPGTPRYVYLGGILTGYGSRPYRASTGFVRLLYTF